MSEHAPVGHEQAPAHTPSPEVQSRNERLATDGSEQITDDQLETIRQNIEQAATHTKIEHQALRGENSNPTPTPTYVNKELKTMALQRSLRRIQRQLPAPVRLFSKVVHQPAIRRASTVTGATVARPSGLLGGGICAFLGSLGYIYATKHLGYTYNYLLFIWLFAGGFCIGLCIELAIRFFGRISR